MEERELALIERALTRRTSGRPAAQLLAGDGTPVDVPAELVDVLVAIVQELKAGNGVSIAALHAELTTVEAAELLNVSRPYLIKQLDAGALPFRMVGSHRRVRLVDVLAYRDRHDARASEALDELTQQAEALGLYD
ncbi:MAG: excisionase family DNA-binding protein [Acidimicrobiales bacterium]